MSKSVAYKHLVRALSRWPVDRLRPDVQLQDAIRRRVDRRFLAPKPASDQNQGALSANGDAPSQAASERYEMEQANLLYSLLEDRYRRVYPVSEALMSPKSNPTYYNDLLAELEEAPNRSWLERLWIRASGLVRLK